MKTRLNSKNKKYRLSQNKLDKGTFIDNLDTVYQIEALIDIPEHGVKKGDLGGWIQNESQLSQTGKAWIKPGIAIFEKSRIEGDILLQIRKTSVKSNMEVGCSVRNSHISGSGVITSFQIENSRIIGEDISFYSTTLYDTVVVGKVVMNHTFIQYGYVIQEGTAFIELQTCRFESEGKVIAISNDDEKKLVLKKVEVYLDEKSRECRIRGYGKMLDIVFHHPLAIRLNGKIQLSYLELFDCCIICLNENEYIQVKGKSGFPLKLQKQEMHLQNVNMKGTQIEINSKCTIVLMDVVLSECSSIISNATDKLVVKDVSLSDFSKIEVGACASKVITDISLCQDEVYCTVT